MRTVAPAESPAIVAGIDIGGLRKGCHLVVLRGREVICNIQSGDPHELARQCNQLGATLVGIDSPCRWAPGMGRLAERELARERISCFVTPTRERALASTSGFYGWMFNGERVYQALAATHPLLEGEEYSGGRACFETFPHAVTWAMLGAGVASARKKREQRRDLLEKAGIDTHSLKSIDDIDAAVCALTAQYLSLGQAKAYGDAEGGYIFVPFAAAVNF
ncbi:hypothetical protein CCR84_07400 [Rhodocyclus purpureus]|nr:hypothetical protein [Rhodocyclus purpureus]